MAIDFLPTFMAAKFESKSVLQHRFLLPAKWEEQKGEISFEASRIIQTSWLIMINQTPEMSSTSISRVATRRCQNKKIFLPQEAVILLLLRLFFWEQIFEKGQTYFCGKFSQSGESCNRWKSFLRRNRLPGKTESHLTWKMLSHCIYLLTLSAIVKVASLQSC